MAQVPPTLDFNWAHVAKNYREVIVSQGMLYFTGNSIIVVGIATLIALVIGTPAAYAFSRLRFRGQRAHGHRTILQLPLHAADRGRDPASS